MKASTPSYPAAAAPTYRRWVLREEPSSSSSSSTAAVTSPAAATNAEQLLTVEKVCTPLAESIEDELQVPRGE